ncbi:pyridoxamine 5'-phosphate oxidase family protein [Bacillus horti]|uniref:Flavin reductase (DIM6/NTAB) family NADH-FMN oxidoreductase RutF n=1 Tax=Caldalkalibacillus horti TaxID=77523 RepID=A0ABT9W1F9_9BACI|nr:pyridoxamine 5'-phosphate oxidase family protein [Bacillus horti]MDQ0166924.1 flavin reductase (DIM6/NTAB) family NADH-FMN oxidoreductase RutF [Bacillus horti]
MAKNTPATELNEDLQGLLQKERFITLATVDHESGAPSVSAISWVYAADAGTIKFAVDHRSRIIENINKNDAVVFNLIGAGSCFSISGKASVESERMEEVPIKLAKVSVSVSEVRDVMFYGAKIVTEPAYDKTYDEEAAAKLDKQVMDALKA